MCRESPEKDLDFTVSWPTQTSQFPRFVLNHLNNIDHLTLSGGIVTSQKNILQTISSEKKSCKEYLPYNGIVCQGKNQVKIITKTPTPPPPPPPPRKSQMVGLLK